MKAPYIADKVSYLTKDPKHTRTVYHPAVYFKEDQAYCYFPDEGTETGLLEYDNEEDALGNAKELYKHYVLDKEESAEVPNDDQSNSSFAQMIGSAVILKADLKYAWEQKEGQTPNQKDVEVMEWLIEQAKRAEMYKNALLTIDSQDEGLVGQFANTAIFEADQRFSMLKNNTKLDKKGMDLYD